MLYVIGLCVCCSIVFPLVFVSAVSVSGGARFRLVLWLVFDNTYPTYAVGRVALCYSKPVLFPPSCRLIDYPYEIRAQGQHALQPCLWWRL